MQSSAIRYTSQTSITNYIPVPRGILSMNLASTAIVLYALLLDRATLSQKHGYQDASGWIYAVFPQEELCQVMQLSPTMIKCHLRSLESAGLIHRVRNSRKEANRYYLLIPFDAVKDTRTDTLPPAKGRKTVSHRGGKLPPNNLNKQQDIIHSYHYEGGDSL